MSRAIKELNKQQIKEGGKILIRQLADLSNDVYDRPSSLVGPLKEEEDEDWRILDYLFIIEGGECKEDRAFLIKGEKCLIGASGVIISEDIWEFKKTLEFFEKVNYGFPQDKKIAFFYNLMVRREYQERGYGFLLTQAYVNKLGRDEYIFAGVVENEAKQTYIKIAKRMDFRYEFVESHNRELKKIASLFAMQKK